jgi:ribosomal protein S18 acetylase RimI-like enzyme
MPPKSDAAPGSIAGGTTPLARILAHDAAYWTCIATPERRDGWTLFHNRDLVPRIDPNHAGDFRAPEGSGPAIARQIVDFYRALGATPAAYVDLFATPHDLPLHLEQAGFREWPDWANDLMLYVGPDEGHPSLNVIETVQTEEQRDDWASVVQDEADDTERALLRRLYRGEIADERVTAYLARIDGLPASRAELLASDGLGRVEAVRTLTAYRGRGLAAAVVRQAVRDSLHHGNLTYIYAEPGGDAQRLYHRLGFRTVATNLIRAWALHEA